MDVTHPPVPVPASMLVRILVVASALIIAVLPASATGVPAQPPPASAPEAVWPLDPRPAVVAPFDPPDAPWLSGHRGVDLAGSPGQAVRSALPGVVGFAGTVAGKPVVTVLHGRRRTTYEPVVATVSSGESVAAGSVIGRLAVVASHCFPAACLHWGLREGETYLDPLSLLGGGPVRLLPLWRDRPRDAAPSTIPLRERWTRPLDAMP